METNQLQQYRKMGLGQFQQLLLNAPKQLTDADSFVDKYIRILSKKPEKPADKPPYAGLYGTERPLDNCRVMATHRLQELVMQLPDLAEVDQEVDKYIRLLSHLPERPSDVKPYASLFVLRDEKAAHQEAAETSNVVGASATNTKTYITSAQLLEIVGSTKLKSRIESLTPGVNETFEKYQINTKLRMAHFLAQVIHESGGFQWLREIWGPTDIQRRYEGRRDLGNTQPGDGKRFMGRGAVQLTGRANYQQFSHAIGVDFISKPELLESAPYAVIVAGWYWDSRKINPYADKDNVIKVTRLINGGTIGLADRQKHLAVAKKVLGI